MKKRALATLGVATVLAVISIIIPMFIKKSNHKCAKYT